jgi:hypothetical protein
MKCLSILQKNDHILSSILFITGPHPPPPPMDLPTFECYIYMCDKVFDEKKPYWDRLTSKWAIRDKHFNEDKDDDGNGLCNIRYK